MGRASEFASAITSLSVAFLSTEAWAAAKDRAIRPSFGEGELDVDVRTSILTSSVIRESAS